MSTQLTVHSLRRPARCALSQTSRCRVQQHQQRCNTRLPIAAVCLQQPACRLQAGAQHRHPSCTDCSVCAFRVRIVEVLRILAGKLALILHGARQYLQTDGAVSLSLYCICTPADSLSRLQPDRLTFHIAVARHRQIVKNYHPFATFLPP